MKKVRIGAGSAGWPDLIDPAVEIAQKGEVQYISFDHLAELTMAILEREKVREPSRGYIPDVVPLMRKLLPVWAEKHFRIISNGGGANPEQCGREIVQLAKELGIRETKIGVVTGDSLPLQRVDELRARGIQFKNLDTGEEDIDEIREKLIAASVYIGADRIIEALAEGADLVIGGRFADNSLYVGPLMYEFGWKYDEEYWDQLGAAIGVGHIMECAGWCAGSGSNLWEEIPEPWRLGYPIAEVDETGEAIITKVPGSGGLINEWTVKEHLVYEVHDPARYIMPDGIADLTAIRVEQAGENKVKLSKAGEKPRGKPRTDSLKLCLFYTDGFITEYIMLIPWPKAIEKAKRCEQFILERLKIEGVEPVDILFSIIGVNTLHGPAAPQPDYDPIEVGLRVAVRTRTEAEARTARLQGTMAWTAAGVGAAFGVPGAIRPVFALWPTLIPREEVLTQLSMIEV